MKDVNSISNLRNLKHLHNNFRKENIYPKK